jgi:hypothetical protein
MVYRHFCKERLKIVAPDGEIILKETRPLVASSLFLLGMVQAPFFCLMLLTLLCVPEE